MIRFAHSTAVEDEEMLFHRSIIVTAEAKLKTCGEKF